MLLSSEREGKHSVLHIWNTAGIGCILAKHQNRLFNWKTWVITRKKFDPFGITDYGETWNCGTYIFYLKALLKSLNYSLIHVRSMDKMVKFSKLIYPGKKIVLHYHGSDIRGRWEERRKYWERADAVIVSTPDLMDGAPVSVVYLHNPIDPDFFRPMTSLRKSNSALFVFMRRAISMGDLEWAEEVAEDRGLELAILDRDNGPVPYGELPDYLNQFEFFIDRRKIPSLSKTALEALSCGLKVIRWDGEIVEGLPEDHRPENVVNCLNEILSELWA